MRYDADRIVILWRGTRRDRGCPGGEPRCMPPTPPGPSGRRAAAALAREWKLRLCVGGLDSFRVAAVSARYGVYLLSVADWAKLERGTGDVACGLPGRVFYNRVLRMWQLPPPVVPRSGVV